MENEDILRPPTKDTQDLSFTPTLNRLNPLLRHKPALRSLPPVPATRPTGHPGGQDKHLTNGFQPTESEFKTAPPKSPVGTGDISLLKQQKRKNKLI